MRGMVTCSGKTVLMTPSRTTMTSLLFNVGNWSISKSIARPALLVSLPDDQSLRTFPEWACYLSPSSVHLTSLRKAPPWQRHMFAASDSRPSPLALPVGNHLKIFISRQTHQVGHPLWVTHPPEEKFYCTFSYTRSVHILKLPQDKAYLARDGPSLCLGNPPRPREL